MSTCVQTNKMFIHRESATQNIDDVVIFPSVVASVSYTYNMVVIYATFTTFFTSTNVHTKAVLLRALGVHMRVRHAVWRPVSALPLYLEETLPRGDKKACPPPSACSAAVVVYNVSNTPYI